MVISFWYSSSNPSIHLRSANTTTANEHEVVRSRSNGGRMMESIFFLPSSESMTRNL